MAVTTFGEITSCTACINAMDLIAIANKIYTQKQKYVQIRVTVDPDHDDTVRISAIPSMDSDDVTIYPDITGLSLLDELDDEFE